VFVVFEFIVGFTSMQASLEFRLIEKQHHSRVCPEISLSSIYEYVILVADKKKLEYTIIIIRINKVFM